MEKKYKLTDETTEWCGHTLHRIEALRDFAGVKKGDKGGWVEKEENLSHDGDCWVTDNAYVSGTARVSGTAWVSGTVWVADNARVRSGKDFLSINGIGSRFDTTTAFKCADDSVEITCGCFYGTVEEFEKAVEKTHGDIKYGREYKAVIELIKVHFGLTGEKE